MSAKIWLCAAAAAMVASSAHAQAYGTDKKRPAGTPELPMCQQPVGTVSIVLPENQWWLRYNLGSPEALIKLYAQRSNCLKVVDRWRGPGHAQHRAQPRLQRRPAARLERRR